MNTDQIRSFIYSVKAGSISGAAKLINLDRSSVSKQITALEQELEINLFERSASRLTLTEEGEYLFNIFDKVLDDIQNALEYVYDSGQLGHSSLTLGLHYTENYKVFNNLFSSFMNSYPSTSFYLRYSDDHDNAHKLLSGQLDIALEMYIPSNLVHGIASFEIGQIDLPIIYSASRNLEKEPISIDSLKNETIVYPSPVKHPGIRPVLDKMVELNILNPDLLVESGEMSDMFTAVKENNSIAFVPFPTIEILPEGIKYMAIDGVPQLPILLLWNKSTKNANVAKFIAFLKGELMEKDGSTPPYKFLKSKK